MRPCGATRAGTQAPPLPISIIFFRTSHTNQITICTQSTQRKPTVHVQSAPTHLHQTTRCAHTHRGYTFDSAGLASATQPTLGNGCKRGGYPQRGLYFLSPQTNDAAPCTIHSQTKRVNNLFTTTNRGGGNASRTPAPSTLNEFRF